ncbi:hypothetical protein ACHAW6_003042 [Cyclotella cf. meneghiniana]
MPSTATAESTTTRMSLRSLHFLLLLAPAMAAPSCSCTPNKYTFRLALSQDCSTNDIADNDGIRKSLCFIEEGVTLPRSSDKRDIVGGPFRGRIRSPAAVDALDAAEDHVDDVTDGSGREQVRRMGQSNRRRLSTAPVEVISIQYLEFDASDTLNVTYTDDSYLSTSLVDGDTFEFYSQTSLPSNDETVGGASLILYGKNEDGELIRNRFFWTFEDCEAALNSVQSGDAIGWVNIDEVAGPYPKNCPAVPADSPTISPRTDEPTFEPTVPTQLTEGPTPANPFTPSPSSSNGGGNGGPPTPANWVTPSPSSGDGGDNGGPTLTTEGPTPANWVTPSPSSGNEGGNGGPTLTTEAPSASSSNGQGTDDESGTTTDDTAGGPDDNDAGIDDSYGNIVDSTGAPTGYYGPSNDVAPAPSPKGTKPGKPFIKSKSGSNAYPNGKTPKHPYDTWGNSYDGGEIPGKSGKSSKGGKTHGKTMKGYDVYYNIYDSSDEDDDHPAYSQRLFSKSSRDGESIR